MREHEEAWYVGLGVGLGHINWWISALGPAGWSSSWCIEQSEINSGVSDLIPGHLVPNVFNNFLGFASGDLDLFVVA